MGNFPKYIYNNYQSRSQLQLFIFLVCLFTAKCHAITQINHDSAILMQLSTYRSPW